MVTEPPVRGPCSKHDGGRDRAWAAQAVQSSLTLVIVSRAREQEILMDRTQGRREQAGVKDDSRVTELSERMSE